MVIKMDKRIISLLLLTSILTAVSCGSTDTGNPTTDSGTDSTTEPQSVDTEKPYLDDLGEYDFGGKDLNMLVRETRVTAIAPDETTGDVVNDAIFNRNTTVGQRFNVNLKAFTLPDDKDTWNKALQGEAMSGSGEYDIVMPDYWWGCETGGYFLNLLDYDVLDFSKPYWSSGWIENAELYGKLYEAVGALSLDLIKNNIAIFFDKPLIDSLGLDDPYELVRSGKWTLDKMLEMADAAKSDLNGDGSIDLENDRIGLGFGTHAGRGIMTGAGFRPTVRTSDGGYEFAFMNERFIDLYNKMYDLMNNNGAVVYCSMNGKTGMGTDPYPVFRNDRLLFLGTGILATDDFRDMKSDYGIIPCPMYDEAQGEYITYNLGTYYMSIMNTAPTPRKCSILSIQRAVSTSPL